MNIEVVAKIEVFQGQDGEIYVSGPLDGPIGKSLCTGMLERAIRKVEAHQSKTSGLVVAQGSIPPAPVNGTNRVRQG